MVGGDHAVCGAAACAHPGSERSVSQAFEGVADLEILHALGVGYHWHAPLGGMADAPGAEALGVDSVDVILVCHALDAVTKRVYESPVIRQAGGDAVWPEGKPAVAGRVD